MEVPQGRPLRPEPRLRPPILRPGEVKGGKSAALFDIIKLSSEAHAAARGHRYENGKDECGKKVKESAATLGFDAKMKRLTGELGELFGESSRLEAQIKANLKAIGYEI